MPYFAIDCSKARRQLGRQPTIACGHFGDGFFANRKASTHYVQIVQLHRTRMQSGKLESFLQSAAVIDQQRLQQKAGFKIKIKLVGVSEGIAGFNRYDGNRSIGDTAIFKHLKDIPPIKDGALALRYCTSTPDITRIERAATL
jgi:hypothetical protein